MSKQAQAPKFEDTIRKVDYLLYTLTGLLQKAADTGEVPNDDIICGAVNMSFGLVEDLNRIHEAHPCL